MRVQYQRNKIRELSLPMWKKILKDYNKGVTTQMMLNNPEYVSPRTGKMYTTAAAIYYILRQLKQIKS